MEIQPLDPSSRAHWNAIAEESCDSWFWHTPEWLGFAKAVGEAFFVDDLSFLILADRRPVAICPLILEDRDGYRRFTYLGEFVPVPAFAPGVTESARAEALDCYTARVAELALMHDVAYTRVVVPPLSQRGSSGGWNPLLRHGYLDISSASRILSPDAAEEALWRDLRKGHRSDVKRAAEACQVTVWGRDTITREKFDEYRTLHAIDAGRVTRNIATFDMMLEWVSSGRAVLVEAERRGTPVAFALIIVFRDGAYYASSCRHPQLDLPAMHLVQWETIKWLKASGCRRYDLGLQYFGASWSHVPSAKELSIARFKRGFGGTTCRVDVVERFFSTTVLEQVGHTRLRALIAAREQHSR
jgi:hypothetical protein